MITPVTMQQQALRLEDGFVDTKPKTGRAAPHVRRSMCKDFLQSGVHEGVRIGTCVSDPREYELVRADECDGCGAFRGARQ